MPSDLNANNKPMPTISNTSNKIAIGFFILI
jgi:hypothetical protein